MRKDGKRNREIAQVVGLSKLLSSSPLLRKFKKILLKDPNLKALIFLLVDRLYWKDKILYINSSPTRGTMLHPSQRQRYQEFQNALEQLHESAIAQNVELDRLQEHHRNVQQLFQDQIASLNADDVAPDYASRWQSLQTEIYKQIGLLQTDVMMFKVSRSAATSGSRLASLNTRINTLIGYCKAMLQ
ncbi:MAG TPA: heterocyst frequency control protein PatD [Chroococcales cyanobacterium]|jgi:hypothetical protein